MSLYYLPDGSLFTDPESGTLIYANDLLITENAGAAPVTGNLVLNMLLYHGAEHMKFKLEKDSNK